MPTKIKSFFNNIFQNKKRRVVASLILAIFIIIPVLFLLFNKNVEAGWWDSDWHYRRSITINHSQIPGDLVNYPMLVSFTDANLASKAQTDGDDIIFVTDNGARLSHEIEKYSSSTGELVAWVKIPALDGDDDSIIYMYYGNGAIDNQQRKNDVWDENFVGVWHMNNTTTSSSTDSTKYNNKGAVTGSASSTTSGKNGSAFLFGGTTDSLRINPNESISNLSNFTVCSWVKTNNNTTGWPAIVTKHNAANTSGWDFYMWTDGSFGTSYYDTTAGTPYLENRNAPITNAVWHYVCGVQNGLGSANMTLYHNGVASSTSPSGGATARADDSANNLLIGNYADASNFFKGTIDEVRVSKTVRSANWVATEYNNQNFPSTFITLGTEERGDAPDLYLPFNEGSGSTAHDESSYRKDGTVAGATWKNESECVSGKCLSYDGNADTATVSSFNFSSSTQFSLSYFLNLKLASTSKVMVGEWGGSQNNFQIKIDDTYSDELKICIASSLTDNCTIYATTTNLNLAVNDWKNIQVVYNGSQSTNATKLKLYVNGTETNLAFAGTIPTTIRATSTAGVVVGGYSGAYITGVIDEFKIYPYARAVSQVAQDYNAGQAGVSSVQGIGSSFGDGSDKWMSQGLVGYWKFDDSATTTVAIDSSGNGNNGTFVNNATTTGGRFGRGTIFDGSGDYINVGASSSLNNLTNITICAWINPSDITSGQILGKSYSIGAGVYFGINAGKVYYERDWTTGYIVYETNSSLATSSWTFVCVSYDSTSPNNIPKIYFDGDEKSVYDAGPSSPSGSISDDSASPVVIGTGNSDLSDYFNGLIDELKIYNRVLSLSEIQQLYKYAPGPVLHLKMDERAGTTTYDSSGNGNNGTINGAVWDTGKFGSALFFDGVNDGATTTDEDYFSPSVNDLSVSFWAMVPKSASAYGDATAGGSGKYFISKVLTSPSNFEWTFENDNNSQFCFSLIQLNGAGFHGNACVSMTINDGQWHHYEGTVDYLNEMVVYVDGARRANSTSFTNTMGNGTQPVLIGQLGLGGSYDYVGKLDDVKIYNYARNQEQILEDMNMGKPALKKPLVDLKFDEGYATTTYDSSGNGLNGTLVSGGSGGNTSVTAMWDKGGRFGGAVDFDGTNDYCEIVNSTAFDFTDSTFSAWIKPNSLTGAQSIMDLDYDEQWFGLNDGTYIVYGRCGTVMLSQTTLDWHHLVWTINGANYVVYEDGKVIGSGSGCSASTDSDRLTIGNTLTHDETFSGLIDEVKVYNYGLSGDEVKTLYNNTSAVSFGNDSVRNNNGTTVTGANKEYCVPGDTARCDKPVLELKLDEKSGTKLYDSSGNGNNGTISSATWDTGKVGGALKFNGTTNYATVVDDPLDIVGDITVSFWMKPGDGVNEGIPLSKYDNSTGWVFDLNDPSGIYFGGRSGGGNIWSDSGATSYTLNQWQFVTGQRSGSNWAIYINGVFRSSTAGDSGYLSSSIDLNIGREGGLGLYFKGLVDDIKIYDYARTQAQIAWDYNRGKEVANWRLDEGVGTVAHDDSFFPGGNGTIYGADWKTEIDCKIGKCLYFGGVSGDYVAIADGSTFDYPVSFSVWVRPTTLAQDGIVLSFDGAIVDQAFGIYNTGNALLFTQNNYGLSGISNYLTANTWQHWLLVYVDNFTAKFYLDGVERPLVNVGDGYTVINTNIGARAGGTQRLFNGYIDDLKIFNYALTAEQVKMVYNGGAVNFR